MLGGVKKLHAHGETLVAVADDDTAVFLHRIRRRLISQFNEKHIGITIVSDDHCWFLQYRFVRLVQYTVNTLRPSEVSTNGIRNNPPRHRLWATLVARSPGTT